MSSETITADMDVFDDLPSNIRAICRCEADSLTEAQKSAYRVWCDRYADKKRGVIPATAKLHRQPNNPKPASSGVGTALHDILVAAGINAPCVTCGSFAKKMDGWGIEACKTERRAEIIQHLNDEAAKAKWLDWAKVAIAGYLSSDALLDESIRVAEASLLDRRAGSLVTPVA